MTLPSPLIQVWDETGSTALGVLVGASSVAVSDVLCDVGSLAFTARRDAPGASLLDVEDDRQLCLSWPPAWGLDPMWFVNDDDRSTWVSDAPLSEPVTFSGRSLAAVLEEALVAPPGGVGTTPTEWTFNGATAGGVVAALFATAQARGVLQGIALAGSAAQDAAGEPWPATVPTLAYKAGVSLLAVLGGLHKAGLLEWRMRGRTLELHRPGGGLDRTLDLTFRPGRDVLAAPLVRTRRHVATAVLVEGAAGATARRTQTLPGRRAREVFVSQTQVTDPAAVGDLHLAAHAAAKAQFSHELADGDGTPLPWRHYRPGDRPLTTAAGPQVVSRRVAQIAARWEADGASVSVELGSLLEDAQEQLERKVAALAPGDTSLT